MSMILDALARAEREREKSHDFSSREMAFDQSPEVRRQPLGLWLAAALLVNALVIAAVLVARPWQDSEDSSSVVETAKENSQSASVAPTEVIQAPVAAVLPDPPVQNVAVKPAITENSGGGLNNALQGQDVVDSSVEDLAKQARTTGSSFTSGKTPVIRKKPLVQYPAEPVRTPSSPSAVSEAISHTSVAAGMSDNNYTKLQDLPAQARNQFSEYEINVHVYDPDPAKSFVLINMTRLRNGDQLPGGPSVYRITPAGVILSQNGTRVLIERN